MTLVGGNISLYTELAENARADAFRLLLEHGAESGGNAHRRPLRRQQITDGVTEVLATTAVIVERPEYDNLSMVPLWCYNGTVMIDNMPVSFSIKDVLMISPTRWERAWRNHARFRRAAILESAVRPRGFQAKALARYVESLGLRTPDESVGMIREDRDTR